MATTTPVTAIAPIVTTAEATTTVATTIADATTTTMTMAATTMSDRRQGVPIAGIAGAVFFVLLIFLALQIRAGKDPAIGAGHQTASVPAQVIVRRVIVTRIVEEDAAPASGPAAPPTRTSVAASGSDAQPQAPAPAAPAPAAPAPVVTRAS